MVGDMILKLPETVSKKAKEGKQEFKLGRDQNKAALDDYILLNFGTMSREHCSILYEKDIGWTITEERNQKPSSKGTHLFLKTQTQLWQNKESDPVPIFDGMVVVFGKYTLRFNLVEKAELSSLDQANVLQQVEDKDPKTKLSKQTKSQ